MSSTPSFIHIVDDAMKAAVFQRFKGFFGLTEQNKDLVFQPKAIVQRKIAEKRGEASVEFISLWRNRITPDWTRQRTPIARDGINLQYQDSNKTSIVTVKAVPTVMEYELRFWSRDLNSVTNAAESYMKWFQDFPNLVVYLNGLYELDFYLKFGSWTDETDYNIYEKGLYYVAEMPLLIDGWVFSEIKTPTVLEIIVDLYLRQFTLGQKSDILLDEFIIEAIP